MSKPFKQSSANRIAKRLIEWFARNARDLPWRRTLNPYAIWVSEVMLQQTQVTTVIPYFERWVKAAPDVNALTKLSSPRLHKLWEGLGYYTRARNLQKAAIQVIDEYEGSIPRDHESILRLCGVGRYTAGAISSIAFNQPQPIVDGNVIRVLSRLNGIEGDPKDKTVVETFWDSARELVETAGRMRSKTKPKNRALKFAGNSSMLNQALMELGATVCTPKNPNCAVCPLKKSCFARLNDCVHAFPQLPERSKPTPRRFIAFVISHNKKYYACQRPDNVVNAHLWELPNVEVDLNDNNAIERSLSTFRLNGAKTEHVRTVKHSITRYRIQTECHRVFGDQQLADCDAKPFTKPHLRKLPFTSAHRRLLDELFG